MPSIAHGKRRFGLAPRVAAVAALAAGCATDQLEYGETSAEATVGDQVSTSGCSTAVVLGLSRQIADEIACEMPNQFVDFSAPGIVLTSNAVLPYLQAGAAQDIQTVAQTRTVNVNSAFRTPPQQYLLRQWYLQGRCGIAAAALPGRSNHESGRALDISGYSLSAMTSNDYAHSVPGDDPHFDHVDSLDLRGQDVKAFQRLWNRNHPEDQITEDGVYGAMTEQRLRAAPATGFPVGAMCNQPPPPIADERRADLVSIAGADRAPPSTSITYRVAILNTGNVEWPASTKLVITDGDSELRAPSWISNGEIATLSSAIGPRQVALVDVEVVTPDVTEETVYNEQLSLTDGTEMFGDNIRIALTVVPDVQQPESGEGTEPTDEEGEPIPPDFGFASGGCSTGGSGAGLLFGLLALVRLRRR
jgi:D-alanyl-D-alanine dipeptidase